MSDTEEQIKINEEQNILKEEQIEIPIEEPEPEPVKPTKIVKKKKISPDERVKMVLGREKKKLEEKMRLEFEEKLRKEKEEEEKIRNLFEKFYLEKKSKNIIEKNKKRKMDAITEKEPVIIEKIIEKQPQNPYDFIFNN